MPSDDVQFLANSPDRLALLADLSDGPATPGDLAAADGPSRRSVQRHLADFADRGWVETSGGTYRLTVTGALVAEAHAEYVATLDRIGEFAPLFDALDDREHAPDPAWLSEATLTVADEEAPHAPLHRYVRCVMRVDADRVRMLSPVLSRIFHEAHASLARRGVHTSLVMPAPVVERARERNPAEFVAVVGADVLTLYRSPEAFRFGLTLAGDRLLLAAYDDEKRLEALLEADGEAVAAWASDLFERYRDGATRVTG
jgi:predicted transcriptional regulator